MAATENGQKISLKLVVDEEKNKVIFAETDRNLVDILLSFLTMPLGTIARLVDTQQESHAIGSLTSLYKGMARLESKYLSTEACKTMLLYPRNSAEYLCKKLQFNIDDTTRTSYYKGCYGCNHLSTFRYTYCNCGHRLSEEVTVRECGISKEMANTKGGVFLNAHSLFIIMDDLQVFPASTNFVLKHLNATDGNKIYTKLLNIGVKEVILILRMSLLTDSSLTNALLSDQLLELPRDTLISSIPLHQLGKEEMTKETENLGETSSICEETITVKLVRKKDDIEVLYAEAGDYFVDLLFSFLSCPLGAVEHLYDGDLKVTSIDNLYKSVKDLDAHKLIGSDNLKDMLISPKIANKFRGKNKLLNIDEEVITPFLHRSKNLRKGGVHEYYLTLTRHEDYAFWADECTIIDPKSAEGSTLSKEGYVKGPATFMVSDDLKVTLFSSYEVLSLLRGINISINDVEEQIIKVGRNEAMSILNASLVSASALTLGLMSNLDKPNA